MENWEKWREAKLQEALDELSQDWDRHVRRLGTEHLEWRCETDALGRDVYHPVGDTIEGCTEFPDQATVEAVNELLTVKLGRFRQCFSVYAHHKIYYGIAGITLDDAVLKRARELGIGTLRKKGNTVEADTAYARAY
jgi:hypothetical protein